jgi:hypothetical protein
MRRWQYAMKPNEIDAFKGKAFGAVSDVTVSSRPIRISLRR